MHKIDGTKASFGESISNISYDARIVNNYHKTIYYSTVMVIMLLQKYLGNSTIFM